MTLARKENEIYLYKKFWRETSSARSLVETPETFFLSEFLYSQKKILV